MGSIKRILIAASIVFLVSSFAPSVKAFGMDESNWPTRITFDEPFQVGNLSLAPGTYEFYLASSPVSRNVIVIYSEDNRRWEGMVMGINVSKKDTPQLSVFTFSEMGADRPQRLEYWFFPEWNRGIKFLYPREEAAGNMSASIAASVK
jgi:hypothetical protein